MRRIPLYLAAPALKRRSQQVREAAKRGIWLGAQRGVTYIVTNVIPKTVVDSASGPRLAPPVDRAQYRAGWRARPTDRGALIYHIDPRMAAIIEYGVRAQNVRIGRAMIAALASWTQRKRLANDVMSARRMAWAIAQSMKKNGMAPRKVLTRATPDIRRFARESMEREIRKALGK